MVFGIPAGSDVSNQENLFLGQLLQVVVICFIDNDIFMEIMLRTHSPLNIMTQILWPHVWMVNVINIISPVTLFQSLVQFPGSPGTHECSFFIIVGTEGLVDFSTRETIACHLLSQEAQGKMSHGTGIPLLWLTQRRPSGYQNSKK